MLGESNKIIREDCLLIDARLARTVGFMPQMPYPGAVEKARSRKRFVAKCARDRVVRRQHRKRFPKRWTEPIVLHVGVTGNTFGAYIRRMMAARGINVTELARRSGLNRSTISGYVNHGPGNIRTETIYLLADALGGDRAEALLAAGNVASDPEVDLILASDWPEVRKVEMIDRLMTRRAEDQARRLADLELLLSERRRAGEAS